MSVFHSWSRVSGMSNVLLGLTLPFSGASSFPSLLISHGGSVSICLLIRYAYTSLFMSITPLHTHTTSPTKHTARKLRRVISKCWIVNWSGGLSWLGVGIFFPASVLCVDAAKFWRQESLFLVCSAKPLDRGWTLGAGARLKCYCIGTGAHRAACSGCSENLKVLLPYNKSIIQSLL